MAANSQVTVSVSLSTEPNLVASYTVTMVNPVPTVGNSNPLEAAAGETVPITLTGTGFVPATSILVNGAVVPSTYKSPTSILAQISAPAGYTGTLSVKAKNPAPAGGTGSAFTIRVECLKLDAVTPDGTNTGYARLGVKVAINTVLTSLPGNPARSWKMQGAGTLATQGNGNGAATYTPPSTIPDNPNVTITVTLASNPVEATSYSFKIVNPIPTVTASQPAQLLSGGTQTLTLTGTGFLPNMSVIYKGDPYPIHYISSKSATVAVNVPADASGTQYLHAQNPNPGGGATTFLNYVPVNTITLTASDSDGTNTGTADLGFPVTMSAVVTGSEKTAVNWSVTGAGSITSTGVYTTPATLPANRAVTIQAALASNPAIVATYSLSIVNPVAVISSTNPIQVPRGETTPVTLTGNGFLPSTVILVNGVNTAMTYVSETKVVANVKVTPHATGNLMIQAQNPAPGGGMGPEFPEAVTLTISKVTAGRILDQTTFGPTTALIQHVKAEGVDAWLAEQFNTPENFLPVVPQNFPSYCGDAEHCVESEWWKTVLTGNDQLRQRVAFALSQIFVISKNNVSGWGVQYYHNVLARDAFTNWFTIMSDVTTTPAMGIYLNMVNSRAAPAGQIANENFARENMQLFNMGLDLINQDGSLQLDANQNPIPAYSQAQVQAFARVFTGWTFANADGTPPTAFGNPTNFYYQLGPVERYHDEGSKKLLNGLTLPAGQSAGQDMYEALNNIFNHPNVPPFVCRQLIQHLVKSEPSPEYISRVAAVFENNGNNVRGDMQSVLTAIFTDPEARAGDTDPQADDGHLREPILWMTGVMRGLGFVNVDPNNYYQFLSRSTQGLGEVVYGSPSVFNFFPATYVIPNTTLVAPEFGLENTASVSDRLSLADTMVNNNLDPFNVDLSATSPLGKILVSKGPAALVNALSDLFLYGTMDAQTANDITGEISSIQSPAQALRVAVYLVITSSEYKILH